MDGRQSAEPNARRRTHPDGGPPQFEPLEHRALLNGAPAPVVAVGGGTVTVAGGRTVVVGTPGADHIEAKVELISGAISVTINGERITTLGPGAPPLTSVYDVRGLGGDDEIFVGNGFGPMADTVVLGGAGRDRIWLESVTIDRTRVRGGAGDDEIMVWQYATTPKPASYRGTTLLGDGGEDTIQAGHGHDVIRGGAGDDLLTGGEGDDSAFGGAGDDTIHGQLDADALFGGDGDDQLSGGRGADAVFGNAGRDAVRGARPGDEDADVLRGGTGRDDVFAG